MKNKWHFIFYCVIILICCLEFFFLFVLFKPFNQKYTNFNRNVIEKHNPKNHKQDLFKKYNPNIFNINQDGRNEAVNINVTEPPVGTPTVEIGSNLSLSLNLIPDISSNYIGLCSQLCYNEEEEVDSCNNRIDYFDSAYSTSFEGNYKTETIFYLDGSFASAVTGFDYITFNNYTFKDKTLLSLFVEINGTLEIQSVIEGVMGLGFDSPIWDQLASDNYPQVIGIALPNFICSIGSISFGGIDPRYIFNANLYNIPALNNTDYPTIKINAIWVNETPLAFPAINAIISTSYNKISLGNFSTQFFTKLGANAFDVTTNSGPIIGIILSSFLTCNSTIKGQCISIFNDEFGPSNNTIIIGALFIQNFYITVNKASRTIGIAQRSEEFCPIPGPTGVQPVPPQTTILPKPTPTFPPPQILNLNRFKDNQSSEFLFQVQIGSDPSQALSIMLDTCINNIGVCSELCYQSSTGSCNNRQHIFDSKNSSSFKLNGTIGSISYLDGSSAKGPFGNDFITLGNFGFVNEFSFLLFNQISGALQAESIVEGIMGVGLSSQIWDQLASKGYNQVIGFALPNSVCDFGSVAFGGIDLRFNDNSNEIYSISTLNDSTYPKINIIMIWVNKTALKFPVINAIISTNYNKISLGKFSTKFFNALGANKTSDGNWVIPNPVDITFDVITVSGPVIGITIPSNLTCNIIKGKCISVFDELPGPPNSTDSIILGIPIIQNYNCAVNKAKS
ncbi:aspartic peptidase domain-containing protein, partial [Gigaspora rosea]